MKQKLYKKKYTSNHKKTKKQIKNKHNFPIPIKQLQILSYKNAFNGLYSIRYAIKTNSPIIIPNGYSAILKFRTPVYQKMIQTFFAISQNIQTINPKYQNQILYHFSVITTLHEPLQIQKQQILKQTLKILTKYPLQLLLYKIPTKTKNLKNQKKYPHPKNKKQKTYSNKKNKIYTPPKSHIS
jgi:hypothetical protein